MTDLTFGKISNGHISAITRYPIHFMYVYFALGNYDRRLDTYFAGGNY